LFNGIEKTVKHVTDQGRCKNNNETFKNQIDEKLQSLGKKHVLIQTEVIFLTNVNHE
jgi:hypothetical protein